MNNNIDSISSENNKNIIYIKTVQSNAIRILCEALKDILTDVNVQISPEGMKIISMDGSKVAVIHLNLEASKFETFICNKTLNAGINMSSLHKIIKSIKNNDIISFFITEDDCNKLKIKIENKDKKTVILTVLKLLDINEDILEIPNILFNEVITMPSNDFQSYIRELSIICNKVKIESSNGKFTLSGDGDFAETEITVGGINPSNEIEKSSDIAQSATSSGIFNIKYLLLFTKSTNLCTTVEIYLKQNFPLILVYNVANLGKLKYCLAPLTED